MSDFDDAVTPGSTAKARNFLAFLIELGRMFKKKDLKEFKFAVGDVISEGEKEQLTEAIDVFQALKQRDLVGPNKLDVLRGYLEAIDRPIMIQKLDEFEDADTRFPLKPRSDNRLEKDGYSISVQGGRHFDTKWGEFVEVRSGSNYSLLLNNQSNKRCMLHVKIDGYEIYPDGIIMWPQYAFTLERPAGEKKKFKFFAIHYAPAKSGINKWRQEENGLIQVKFSPEREDMKIKCVASGSKSQTISCSAEVTDKEFLKMVSRVFGGGAVTVMVNKCAKPLGKRGIKLVHYGVGDGSQVTVNVGGAGGTVRRTSASKKDAYSRKKNEWRNGASTTEDESDQEFFDGRGFPIVPSQAVTLNLRLVAHKNETPLPSTGNPTPLTKATLIPPHVMN